MPQKWEYKVIKYMTAELRTPYVSYDNNDKQSKLLKSGPDLYEFLNKLGQEGWEAVSMTDNNHVGHVLLKRPLP